METLEDAATPNAAGERENVTALRAGIIASLNERLIAAGKTPVLAPVYDQADEQSAKKYARRITFSAKAPVDVAKLVSLYSLYSAEAKFLANYEKTISTAQITALDGSGRRIFRRFTAEEQNAMLENMRAHVQAMSDKPARQLYAEYKSGAPTTHRMKLEAWAKIHGPPNDAELLMLGRYLGVDVWKIFDWFKAKGLQQKAYKMVIGDAFSRDESSRKYGFTRFQAARVQTKWFRHLKGFARRQGRKGRQKLTSRMLEKAKRQLSH